MKIACLRINDLVFFFDSQRQRNIWQSHFLLSPVAAKFAPVTVPILPLLLMASPEIADDPFDCLRLTFSP
jgi:hypothetical protein